MPASTVDFTALSHIIHFSLVPNPNGTLNSSANGITGANAADLVSKAHAAGKKALICLGGASTGSFFQSATTNGILPYFISNITNFMASYEYDGIDLDWEPLTAADSQQFTNLVNGLRSALDAFPQHKMLTAAVGAYPPYGDPPAFEYAMFASLQNQFDQINIMAYDLSGPYGGWVTWFNSPIYDGGFRFPSTGGLVPSINGSVMNFITNGMLPAKLGIGVAFYGYAWEGGTGTTTGGVTLPRQSWTSAPTVSEPGYSSIMASYYQPNLYHWDTSAQAAYLSISNSDPAYDMFISYDDPHTCQAKVSYARNLGLGGLMIWELAQDHQSGQPDPLLQTIRQALATPGVVMIQLTNQDLSLSFTGLPLASYHILWASNLSTTGWSTLAMTNVSGNMGVLQFADPDSTGQPQRFYRVRTP